MTKPFHMKGVAVFLRRSAKDGAPSDTAFRAPGGPEMKLTREGGVIVLLLPVVLGLFMVTMIVANASLANYAACRAQTTADVTLTSSLKLRAEGLEMIAERWSTIGSHFIGGDEDGVVMPSSKWADVELMARKLKNALPGYKGRISAVVRVVAGANGVKREDVKVINGRASEIGISPRSQKVRDLGGNTTIMDGVWYARLWSLQSKNAEPDGISAHLISLPAPAVLGPRWAIQSVASGRLKWDVDREDPWISNYGNGGFPRNWTEALNGTRVDPHRVPYYAAELIAEPSQYEIHR